MVQFDYDYDQFNYDKEVYKIKIPANLAGEDFMVEVGKIELQDKDVHIELFNKVPVKSLRNILLNWDEYFYQLNRQQKEILKGKKDGDRTDK